MARMKQMRETLSLFSRSAQLHLLIREEFRFHFPNITGSFFVKGSTIESMLPLLTSAAGDNKVVSSPPLLTEYPDPAHHGGGGAGGGGGGSVSAAETFPFYWKLETSIARKRGSFRLLPWNPNWVTCEHSGRARRGTSSACVAQLRDDAPLNPSGTRWEYSCTI
ncbi:hypothetical protein WN51_00088 [Melipona quadrifasciata]|uniref:Uncharacterized protein n=1 Tax=Melipona quadrifasciata TaxID=166423 RepID=A0A0N0BKW4_9HYME|nr:hypothetical protein WN51_00088 [Melipona quadrifasciata]